MIEKIVFVDDVTEEVLHTFTVQEAGDPRVPYNILDAHGYTIYDMWYSDNTLTIYVE